MTRRSWFILLAVCLIVGIGYNNCNPPGTDSVRSTSVGNPFSSSMKIVSSACQIIMKAHPEVTSDQCQIGILSTSFSDTLGVPSNILNPFRTLADAEQNGAVKADPDPLNRCLSGIQNLDPLSPQVQGAYNGGLFDPFKGVVQMIPSSSGCPDVYKNNAFATPTPFPSPPPGTVIVNFDNPVPTELVGIFQGIDFGSGVWAWQPAYDADTTNFAYNGVKTANDLVFSFSRGPKILVSMNVFAKAPGRTVTVYDDQGQSVSQFIPHDQMMHTLTTGFVLPSNTIKITDPQNDIGIDDIAYAIPQQTNPIVHVQSRDSSDGEVSGGIHSLAFLSDNTAGDLIVVQANWQNGIMAQSVQDTAGNSYVALPVGQNSVGNKMQIWYAKNIAGGPNTVTATFTGSVQNSNIFSDLYIHEYAGLDRASPLDATGSATGYDASPNSGSVLTHFPNELIFGGFCGDFVDPDVPGPGFTFRTWFDGNIGEDRVVTQVGSYNASAKLRNDGHWISQIVTFKGAIQPSP